MIYFKKSNVLTKVAIPWWDEEQSTLDVPGAVLLSTFLLVKYNTLMDVSAALTAIETPSCNWKLSYIPILKCQKHATTTRSPSPSPMRSVTTTPSKPKESLQSIHMLSKQSPNPLFPWIDKGENVYVLVPEVGRRHRDLNRIAPDHPLLKLTLHSIKDNYMYRPTANELCDKNDFQNIYPVYCMTLLYPAS